MGFLLYTRFSSETIVQLKKRYLFEERSVLSGQPAKLVSGMPSFWKDPAETQTFN